MSNLLRRVPVWIAAASVLPAAAASGAIITATSGVYDEQAVQLNAVDQTASGPATNVNLLSLTAMKSDVAAAFTAGTGGVINFDDVTTATSGQSQINATYGPSGSQTLTLTGVSYQVDMSALATIGATPISGNTYLRNGASTGIQGFAFSTPLSEVGVTVLARTGARSITATVTYDDATTGTLGPVAIPSVSGSGDTSSPDTFFGFAAPAGRTITSLSLAAGANNFYVVDDIGFVTVPEPTSLGLLAIGGIGLLGRRRRSVRGGK